MLVSAPSASTSHSALWGQTGEHWTPDSRLPDFSWAGYHSGLEEPPRLPTGISVKTFGAVGDGVHDDTDAFLQAIAEAQGAIEIPAGRYKITRILEITRPNVVLRGEGPDRTVLFCPVHLTDIRPDWGATTSGKRTSNYSWSGGIVWFRGRADFPRLTPIVGTAKRGASTLAVSDSSSLRPGQRIMIRQSDTPENTLARHLYSNDPGDTAQLKGSVVARLVCRIVAVRGNEIDFDRPLRFDVDPSWSPEILGFDPTVSECGIEDLGFEFPEVPYAGHFLELGYNALAITHAADCWARNLRIHNSDSGMFVFGYFCSFSGITLACSRPEDPVSQCTGHHGVYFQGDDNLFTNFDYQTRFIHDISLCLGAGNVFSEGRGIDLCFDHHKRAPYENLFTNIDLGQGSRPWRCGGGWALGKHCAGRGTFWNLISRDPIPYPFEDFGPPSMNLVGLRSSDPAATEYNGRWLEATSGTPITPPNLHQAQVQKRAAQV